MELNVHEIFASIQGESTHVGEPCAFVRLAGCNLRCAWCDAAYALEGGTTMTLDAVLAKVREIDLEYVELTGGEPLIQEGSIPLLEALVDDDFTVMLETNGTIDLSNVPDEVIKVMDVKCPSSAMSGKNLLRNVDFLSGRDEVKFVMADRADYDWAKQVLKSNRKFEHVHAVHFTPVAGRLDLGTLADWVLADKLPVRLGFQLHKMIWGADTKR
jgi:7-carboxy-7-deazaguanine synthase